jgi:serine/threonine protein kinase
MMRQYGMGYEKQNIVKTLTLECGVFGQAAAPLWRTHQAMSKNSSTSQIGPTGFGVSTVSGVGGPDVAADDVLTLPNGTRIAEFVITGLIGIGGFGIVYKAHDETLGRVVALKEYMPSTLAYRQDGQTVSVKSNRLLDTFQAGLRSFVNEARMLALFDHPALVKVYRFWEANGTAYMVMPLYEGQTLKQAMAAMPERPTEAWLCQILAPLLGALEIIHAKNCFHRDIAPDNIFLLANGQPVLLDFGAARQVIGDMANNLTVILKPGYAPIEQYASDPNMPQGAWTDIYALGAVLYHAITGKPPNVAVGRLVKDSYQPLASSDRPAFSKQFLHAVDSALSVKQSDRPQTIDAFRQLLGIQALNPVTGIYTPAAATATAANPTVSSNPPNPSASSKSVVLFAGLAGAAVLAMGAYFMMGKNPGPIESAVALPPAPTAVAALPAASAVIPQVTPAPAPSAPVPVPVPVPAPTLSQLASASAVVPTVKTQPPASAPVINKPKPVVATAKAVEERQPVTNVAPVAVAVPVPAPAKPAVEIAQKPAPEKPDWLTELRKRLASCDEKNLVERVFCVERARRKLCEPDHWGKVDECKVSTNPVNEGRW